MELNVPMPHHEGYFSLEACQSQGNSKSALSMMVFPVWFLLVFLWRQMKGHAPRKLTVAVTTGNLIPNEFRISKGHSTQPTRHIDLVLYNILLIIF